MISKLDLVKRVEFSSLAQFYPIIDDQDAPCGLGLDPSVVGMTRIQTNMII